MPKRQKTLNLPDEVLEPLEKEDNQSAKVEKLLRKEYGL